MKKLLIIAALFMVPLFTLHVFPVMADSSNEEVKVFYFHLTRRCATCTAVENVSRNYLEKVYGDRVMFESYNLDKKEEKEIADLYKVSGQALIVVKGDLKVDLTAAAFMNALSKPEKLEVLLFETVNPLLVVD